MECETKSKQGNHCNIHQSNAVNCDESSNVAHIPEMEPVNHNIYINIRGSNEHPFTDEAY
jgi:hypothetical protein